jgi:hypothetical protein
VRDPVTNDDDDDQSQIPSILLQPEAPNEAVSPSEDARILFDAATTALQGVAPAAAPEATSQSNRPNETTRISHGRAAVNEYIEFARICEGAFVWQFPLGCPFTTVPSHEELRHLFLQADNRAADDDEFAMYMWNARARADVCAGVVRGWRTNPRLFGQIRQLADDPNILSRLEHAKANPSSQNAQDLLRQLRPVLMATSARVQFGNSGANSAAFAKIVAHHRVAGNGAFFITVNPRLHEEELPLRLTIPITSNTGPLDGTRQGEYPRTVKARKAQLIDHPIGSSLGFILFRDALFRCMLRLPLFSMRAGPPRATASGSHLRGIAGDLKVGLVSVENSASGAIHLHLEGTFPPFGCTYLSQAAHAVTSDFVSSIVHDPVQNRALGDYLQSIIASFLDHDENGWLANISSEPWVLNGDRPTATEAPTHFQRFFAGLARRYQDHRFHNHSCFKASAPGGAVDLSPQSRQSAPRSTARGEDPSSLALATIRSESLAPPRPNAAGKRLKESLCRFIRPVPAFPYAPQYVQLVMLEVESSGSRGPTFVVRALRGVEAPPIGQGLSLISREGRCLEFQFARPAATPSAEQDLFHGPYLPLEDGVDPNCWFIECNRAITVGTGAHNNIQLLDGRDLGGAAYMSKYVVKNNLKPEKSLSILYEALQHVARYPSVLLESSADQAARRLIHIVQRVLNSTKGAIELSMPLILGKLLGLQQFESSHVTKSVYLADAVGFVRQIAKRRSSAEPEEMRGDAAPSDTEAYVPGLVADNDDDDDAHGDLARDRTGRLSFVSQKLDYFYRDELLAKWNFAEFNITFYKVLNESARDEAGGT